MRNLNIANVLRKEVRKLRNENYDIIELDQAGRVTRAVEDVREFRMETSILSWNSERGSSWRNLYEEWEVAEVLIRQR